MEPTLSDEKGSRQNKLTFRSVREACACQCTVSGFSISINPQQCLDPHKSKWPDRPRQINAAEKYKSGNSAF